jgi:transcriptional regulator with XRE-family HTH domain
MQLEMEATEIFRVNMREAMERKSMTIARLATLVGTSASGISCILSGKDGVTIARAARIAKCLEVELTELLTENSLTHA